MADPPYKTTCARNRAVLKNMRGEQRLSGERTHATSIKNYMSMLSLCVGGGASARGELLIFKKWLGGKGLSARLEERERERERKRAVYLRGKVLRTRFPPHWHPHTRSVLELCVLSPHNEPSLFVILCNICIESLSCAGACSYSLPMSVCSALHTIAVAWEPFTMNDQLAVFFEKGWVIG